MGRILHECHLNKTAEYFWGQRMSVQWKPRCTEGRKMRFRAFSTPPSDFHNYVEHKSQNALLYNFYFRKKVVHYKMFY